jgi:prophage regulatory protein
MDKLLRRSDVEDLVALRRSAIYALMSENKFPKPLRVAGRAVRWSQADIQQWIESTKAGAA